MDCSKEKVLDLARQIYMGLEDEEVEKLSKDLEQMVTDIKVIEEADISSIDRQDVSVLNYYNSFRKDEVIEYEDKEALLKNATEVEQSMFKIPKIV